MLEGTGLTRCKILFGMLGSWKIVLVASIGMEYERRSWTAGALREYALPSFLGWYDSLNFFKGLKGDEKDHDFVGRRRKLWV
jgi:hypothetical protein